MSSGAVTHPDCRNITAGSQGCAPQLVLCEGLSREEVERDSVRAGSKDGLYDGHVEHDRFSGGRGRRKGHVLACNSRVDGERLMLKQPIHPAR